MSPVAAPTSGPSTTVHLHGPVYTARGTKAPEPAAEDRAAEVRRLAPLDCLLLAAVVFLSAVPYVPGLGLYGEDWTILSALERAVSGADDVLAASQLAALGMSPLDVHYLTALHRIFRLDLVGYHAVNTAVLATGVILFYFASLYADVRFVTRPRGAGWLWKAAGAAALVGSLLVYESTAGLLAFNVVVLLGLAGISREPAQELALPPVVRGETALTSVISRLTRTASRLTSATSRLTGLLQMVKAPGRMLASEPSPWREAIRTPWTLEAQTVELATQAVDQAATAAPATPAVEWWMLEPTLAGVDQRRVGLRVKLALARLRLRRRRLSAFDTTSLGPADLGLTTALPAAPRWSFPSARLCAGLLINLVLLGVVMLSGPDRGTGAEPAITSAGLNRLISNALTVSFFDNGLALPVKAVEALLFHANATSIAVSLMIGCGVCMYVFAGRHEEGSFGDGESWALFVLFGGVLFAAGCAALAITGDFDLHPTGSVNHAAIVGSIGVAWIFAGLTGWIVSRIPPEPSRWMVFSVAIGALAGSGALITGTIGRYWASAASEQYRVIERAHQHFPTLAAGTTLLLDGICPYVGPAPVFTSESDVSSMLHLAYGDPTLHGGVMSHNARLTDDGIHPGGRPDTSTLAYGENLIVFHVPTGESAILSSAEAAREYFLSLSLPARPECPPYSDGTGAVVF